MNIVKQCLLVIISAASLILQAQTSKTAPGKTTTAAKKVTATTSANEYVNTLSFTMEDEVDGSRQIIITSVKKGGKVSDYWNCAVIDKVANPPMMKIDIKDKNNEQLELSMSLPILTTGSAEATEESNYNHTCDWFCIMKGHTNGIGDIDINPNSITVNVTQWPATGAYAEGTFSGTAVAKKVLSTAYGDVKEYPCTISNGKFKIVRVEDQNGYGGE